MTPAAMDIERLAVAMAAAHGLRFDQLDDDSKANLRVSASAALIRLGIDARTKGKARLAQSLTDAVDHMRRAAVYLDAPDTPKALEGTLRGLISGAAILETVGRVLMALPDAASNEAAKSDAAGGVEAASTPETEDEAV